MKLKENWQVYFSNRKNVREKTEKKKTFRRIFLGISLSMLVVILLGSGLMYYMVKKVIIDQNIQMSLQAFGQVLADFEEANGTANMIATQVKLDDVCSELLTAASGEWPNSITLGKVRNQLSMYQNTNPTVETIYVYNENLDLFITSGSRFGAVGKADFSDQNIVELLNDPATRSTHNLIRREMTTKYLNGTDKTEVVYSYILYSAEQGSAVVVNMKFDKLLQEILNMEIMKDSRMLIIDENKNRLVDLQTCPVEETTALRKKVLDIADKGIRYQEVRVDGAAYFISYLYSDNSRWNYVKITRWESMFHMIQEFQKWAAGLTLVIIIAAVAAALGNSLSILRMHGNLERKYANLPKRSDLNLLKEGFLSDFLHNRKLFGKNQLRLQMEKFGFTECEKNRYTVLILQLESYDGFREMYGQKGTFDIKFGFQNIFEETFSSCFRLMGLINRDHTLTFLLETAGTEEEVQKKVQECFRNFCKNVEVFVKWKFSLVGTERSVSLEKVPELNGKLKEIMQEQFFYPGNTYFTYEQIREEHSEKVDFHQLEEGSIPQMLRCGQDVRVLYQDFAGKLSRCSMVEYMNAMIWLGITVARSVKDFMPSDRDANGFLTALTKCEKAAEADALFYGLFEQIHENQEKTAVKKGVTGRLDEVKKYIEENFLDPNITLEQLGDEFSVSPNYLGRLFKKEMGMSVADFINGERLKKVLRELEVTDRSAKDIAEDCGFVSSNYFYTYFRKRVGVTPQVYRQQLREQKINGREKEK